MTAQNLTLILIFTASFALLVSAPVRRNRNWSAMVTPLASIIGSGFLVSVPLLASAIGIWAVAAVVGLTLLAYLFGGAIRYNIRYGEPVFALEKPGHPVRSFETLSQLVLTGAYFISVAYYLVLLAAFGLKLLHLHDPTLIKLISTALISAICLTGATRGLRGVERAEKFTVSANLAAIAALLAALLAFGLGLPPGYDWTSAAQVHHAFDANSVRFLMGLVIIVQGFETTRFMGDLYDRDTRIRAMTRAQIASSAIYVVFFILMIPLFPFFTSTTDVAGFIDVIGRVTPWLPFVVTAGAIASQFSASVADSIAASELIHSISHRHITPKHAYIVIGAIAVNVIWDTNVVSIVTLASRAFALFYAFQCVVAFAVAAHRDDLGRAAWFFLLAVIAFAIAVLGIPASG